MDGNRELEQLDAEARALKATLMRYMSEAMLEDQGLSKLSAELTKIVQASQRHSAESTARSDQKVQGLAGTVDALRAEVRTLLHQSHEHIVREVRTVVSEQLSKKKKVSDADEIAERLDRLQLEVRNLARSLQNREARPAAATARPVAIDVDDAPARRGKRVAAPQERMATLASWRIAAPLAVLFAVSVGCTVWWATRPVRPPLETAPTASLPTSKVPAPPAMVVDKAPVQNIVVPAQPPDPGPAAVAPTLKQGAWDAIWKGALDLPMQQCWFEAKSNAKAGSKFRDCACPKAEKEAACEWSAKWSAEASVAALQAVLSVAAAKTMTIDARAGTGTFNAIELLVRDCGFKDAALTKSIEELRATRGKVLAGGGEPATHQILGFLKKNLHSCR
jgi:hypothetical protein